MSGDWIKVEVSLPEKPEVWQMAGILGIDPDSVVGKLLKVWRWFDAHTESGNAAGVTYALVDSVSGVTGFAEAMALCSWLEQDGSFLRLPNFSRHNGKTAKNRALTAKRAAGFRERSNAESNGDSVTHALPREEKRREEKEAKALVQRAARFDEFWAAYPVKKGKEDARKKWKSRGLDSIADRIIADVKARLSTDRQWREGYIPHGSTYVNGSGWEDEIESGRKEANGVSAFDYAR